MRTGWPSTSSLRLISLNTHGPNCQRRPPPGEVSEVMGLLMIAIGVASAGFGHHAEGLAPPPLSREVFIPRVVRSGSVYIGPLSSFTGAMGAECHRGQANTSRTSASAWAAPGFSVMPAFHSKRPVFSALRACAALITPGRIGRFQEAVPPVDSKTDSRFLA